MCSFYCFYVLYRTFLSCQHSFVPYYCFYGHLSVQEFLPWFSSSMSEINWNWKLKWHAYGKLLFCAFFILLFYLRDATVWRGILSQRVCLSQAGTASKTQTLRFPQFIIHYVIKKFGYLKLRALPSETFCQLFRTNISPYTVRWPLSTSLTDGHCQFITVNAHLCVQRDVTDMTQRDVTDMTQRVARVRLLGSTSLVLSVPNMLSY